MAGSELNALSAAGVPLVNAKLVVVFHGAALDGILNDASYKAKFAVANPNLEVLAQFKKAGTEPSFAAKMLPRQRSIPRQSLRTSPSPVTRSLY